MLFTVYHTGTPYNEKYVDPIISPLECYTTPGAEFPLKTTNWGEMLTMYSGSGALCSLSYLLILASYYWV
jgi:hypothetical protein